MAAVHESKINDCENDKIWNQKIVRKFGKKGDAETEAGQNNGARSRSCEKFGETENGKEHAQGGADICCNIVAVGEDDGREAEEIGGQKRPPIAQKFPRPNVNQNRRKKGENYREDSGISDDLVGVVAHAVEKLGAGFPLAVYVIGPGRVAQRKIEVHEKQGNRRERFYERRMFGVQSVVEIFHVAVTGRDVSGFVKNSGFEPGRIPHQSERGAENRD